VTSTPNTPGSRTKVVVAMSGGVDSSVAAALLLRQGYEVVGCFMRLGSVEERDETACETDSGTAGATGAKPGVRSNALPQAPRVPRANKQGCCSVNDAADARLVAAHLGVPFYAVNFERDFDRVIDYFVDEYNAGRTPNPCVRCNDWLKFGRLHALAKDLGAAFVASGHYARVERDASGRARLLRGVDHTKDQSYVLFGTPRDRVEEMLLPIGGMQKSRVRELAREFGLPVFDKPDSQEICFVPDNDYAGLVARRRPDAMQRGAILDEQGREIGTHDGHQHFTIGQRRGVPIALGTPVHVIDRDPRANTITVGPRERLLRTHCKASRTNWLMAPPAEFIACTAKVRSTATPTPARVRAFDAVHAAPAALAAEAGHADNSGASARSDALEVIFDEPVEAIAPGQAVVCYRDDELIGGGWIDSAR